MVDSSSYVEGGVPKWGKIAGALVSSYILAVASGLTDFLMALWSLPGNLLRDLLTWIGGTAGMGFGAAENTIDYSWDVVADIFPIAGPLDFILGVGLVIFTFTAFEWMFGRLLEGLR